MFVSVSCMTCRACEALREPSWAAGGWARTTNLLLLLHPLPLLLLLWLLLLGAGISGTRAYPRLGYARDPGVVAISVYPDPDIPGLGYIRELGATVTWD